MLKKICGILEGILIVILAAIALILLVPRIFGIQTLAVVSGSMEPKIPVGSIVFTQDVADAATLSESDVITYSLGDGTYVTHRIVAIDTANETVTTKGDANDVEDANPVPYTQIVGKMLFHLPLLGFISIYAKTPMGIAVICGVVILLILLNFLPDVFAKEEKENQKETTKQVTKED